jgi:uncharacterized protein
MTAASVPPELLNAVVEYFRPLRVILFGSVARGDAGPDSDIDLLVILDDDAPPEHLTLAAGYQARRSYHRAADVIPCRAFGVQPQKPDRRDLGLPGNERGRDRL